MTAPTEAEIREALEARFNYPTDSSARDMAFIDYLSDGLLKVWPIARDEDQDEADREPTVLEAMIKEAIPRIEERCREVAMEALIEVGLRFAAAYPDAPRNLEEVPA